MSQDEPFGNIYIEALASGLPIVAHDSTVTRWIVEGHGNLVDTSNGAAVTNALSSALHITRTDDLAARRAFAQTRFSWETITEQYCQFFQRVYGS
jgi:glycosyltransferase involved in cell wall biosynthesis